MRHRLQPIEAAPSAVLGHLRALVPLRAVSFAESLRLAERLAARLLELYTLDAVPVPVEIIRDLPKIKVQVDPLMPELTSGLSVWDARQGHWIISLNPREPSTRQRFTTLHEFFHIVVHNRAAAGLFQFLSDRQIELAADYFAGCVLVPKRFLLRAWTAGVQRPEQLAATFGVSVRAIEVRLGQVGLTGKTREFQAIRQIQSEVAW
jgi:Zn-dependent peptidase ImmA (M78 family)